MVIEVKTKKWGNSIGIVIPREFVEKLNIKPEENLVIEVKTRENVLKGLFGSIKFRRPIKDIIKEVREDLEGKWLK